MPATVGLSAIGLQHPISFPQRVGESPCAPSGLSLILSLDNEFVALALYRLVLPMPQGLPLAGPNSSYRDSK